MIGNIVCHYSQLALRFKKKKKEKEKGKIFVIIKLYWNEVTRKSMSIGIILSHG